MTEENRSFLLAILLSIAVLIGWNLFVAGPRIAEEQERIEREQRAAGGNQVPQAGDARPATGDKAPAVTGDTQPATSAPATLDATNPAAITSAPSGIGQPIPSADTNGAPAETREAAIAAGRRVAIETPSLTGSINLTGALLDDLELTKYRETTDPSSPPIRLLEPAASNDTYYIEHGWAGGSGSIINGKTKWQAESRGPLTPSNPAVLIHRTADGLVFRRTITVDDNYMFTVRQEVENTSSEARSLFPYAFISREGEPEGENIWILHEGLIGVSQKDGLTEVDYSDIIEERRKVFEGTSGWIGITDKYWAAALIPDQGSTFKAEMVGRRAGGQNFYQTNYARASLPIAPGAKVSVDGRVFAGAKRADLIRAYEADLNLDRFNLMIDWGWFWFITKPLYILLVAIYDVVKNYGLAIILVTVLIKIAFFPLANKSYVSMSRMKKLQPEMERIRERFSDDRTRQQQAMMELYQEEKINPMAGCLPILLQIPVFFALYKVLFVSIEMRHAPFF
ncbi:MAG: membrane protein insertase YidC, partial [Pseudomonadota bacterium]